MYHDLGRKASNEVQHDVDKKPLIDTNLLCCFLFCSLLRFQHRLLTQGFPPLWMMVSDDTEVIQFPLHTEIHNFLVRILLGL